MYMYMHMHMYMYMYVYMYMYMYIYMYMYMFWHLPTSHRHKVESGTAFLMHSNTFCKRIALNILFTLPG
jgi:hypothetical protein